MVWDIHTIFVGKVLEYPAQSDAPFIVEDEDLATPIGLVL
jgi:hypothetical protein